jgi:hypothetical protein
LKVGIIASASLILPLIETQDSGKIFSLALEHSTSAHSGSNAHGDDASL